MDIGQQLDREKTSCTFQSGKGKEPTSKKDDCERCLEGMYSAGASVCQECPIGKVSSAARDKCTATPSKPLYKQVGGCLFVYVLFSPCLTIGLDVGRGWYAADTDGLCRSIHCRAEEEAGAAC